MLVPTPLQQGLKDLMHCHTTPQIKIAFGQHRTRKLLPGISSEIDYSYNINGLLELFQTVSLQ